MNIRAFQPGDETVQAELYNEAAAALPSFKPAPLQDVLRRVQGRDFDPETRLFAVQERGAVGYISWQTNGRIGYPWCRRGHEKIREVLLKAALEALTRRGFTRVYAAYRADWKEIGRFFLGHGFKQAREMVNFAVELPDLRLPDSSSPRHMTPLREQDVDGILSLVPGALHVTTADPLRDYLFRNPYFDPECLFVCRAHQDPRQVAAVGIVIEKPPYADPRKVDSAMPCFRLGAFGTEKMTHKRINGMFSFLAPAGPDFDSIARDVLEHAAQLLRQANASTIGAQVASDQTHLLDFYKRFFNRQGSFPVFEKAL
jgi:hypothetical protein